VPNDIKHMDLRQMNPKVCKYTKEGRKLVHDERAINIDDLFIHFEENPNYHESVEFNVNRIAALSSQQGICRITNQRLKVGHIETHHKKPVEQGGTNATSNLILLNCRAHRMIHMKDLLKIRETFEKLKRSLSMKLNDRTFLKNLNKYRKEVGNDELTLSHIGAR
jgi:hypothetical protein